MNNRIKIYHLLTTATLFICGSLIFTQSAVANEMVTVNIDNFVRAETAAQIDRALKMKAHLLLRGKKASKALK